MFEQIRQFINQHMELTEEEFQTLVSKFYPVSFDKKTKVLRGLVSK